MENYNECIRVASKAIIGNALDQASAKTSAMFAFRALAKDAIILSKESDAQIVIARYDADGVLMDIKAPNAFSAGDAQSMFEEVLTGCEKTDTIKVFCFDSLDTVKFLGEYEVLEPAQ